MLLSNLHKYSEDFLFLPLGGVGEIGMNAYLYQYKGKWILVDLGIGFATNNQNLPGIDVILPDISFIKKIKDDLLAIVVTHAHEDHCGAIHFLWDEIECPVYADAFTIEFIRNKCMQNNSCTGIPLNVLGERLKIGPFDMEFIHMTHSIPFMNGIVFRTEFGNYFHTGDWKIDNNPVIGKISNLERLKEIQENEGFKGVISDSTNVTIKGKTANEGSIIESLENIFRESKSLIACTMFASNVARLRTFCNVAKKFDRKIAVFGRSLNNIINISHQFSFFNDVEFLEPEQVMSVPREKLLIICTGCQGEELAAMSSLALNKNRFIELQAGDTIVFSSKTIPGNELNVSSVINKLITKNVHVITERTHTVHVSGHPGCEDLKILYEILKPNFIIPVHGEALHLREHVNFAKSIDGINDAIFTKNGALLNLSGNKIQTIDILDVNFLCLDGKFEIINPKDETIRERGFLGKNGIILVVLLVDKQMHLLKTPRVLSFGILNYRSRKGANILKKMSSYIENNIFDNSESYDNKSNIMNANVIRNKVRNHLRNVCKKETGKMPVIEINVDILSDK